MVEKIKTGEMSTPFLKDGDVVRIDVHDDREHSIFGVIEQTVVVDAAFVDSRLVTLTSGSMTPTYGAGETITVSNIADVTPAFWDERIAVNLRHNGFAPTVVFDGAAAQREVDAVLPDVILLDWMLPGQSGLSLARKWRADSRTKPIPILMLTARGDEPDKIAGLDAGADDYITKPFSTQELLARLRAVLRRRAPEQVSDSVTIGELVLDAGTYRVTFQGQPLKVGPTEFKLLHFLMKHPERVHTRGSLLDRVWGDHVFIEERTVDVHVKRLRESLGDAGKMIETVRGAGYRLSAQAVLKLARAGIAASA